MKLLKLTILINKPTEQVFEFTLNPNNTPKWIDGITREEASPLPVQLGTIYRNTSDGKTWAMYEITALEPGVRFVMSRKESGYHVRYTFSPVDEGTQLEYFEWTLEGELDNPFSMEPLLKLKQIMES
jgi:uncharacterized protein YndB with AHSA1/START domain